MTPNIFAKPWKMSEMLDIGLSLERFGFGWKDAIFVSNEKFEKCRRWVWSRPR